MRIKLKEARIRKGATQEETAAHLNMAVTSYQRIELGLRGTSESNWIKLFHFFDGRTPLHELMENLPQRQLRETEKEPDGNPALK